MTGKHLMTNRTFAASAAMALLLAGCDDAGNFQMPGFLQGSSDEATAEVGALPLPGPTVERDVEAPEVFSVTDQGLWDGRPSLGGVWVAHPDVGEPERVIIRNQSTGNSVIGALFRRERENPGPSLQVSSDAAQELGVIAGQPTMLSVVALRRQEAAADVAPAAIADFENPEEITATPLDDIAGVAAAAIDAADLSDAPAAEASLAVDPVPAPAPAAPAPVPAAPVSSLDKPYIQIGIFSIEANASQTAERMRANGLSTRVLDQESQGKRFWRVVVGPAPNAADREAVLEKVKSLGFADAYAVTN